MGMFLELVEEVAGESVKYFWYDSNSKLMSCFKARKELTTFVTPLFIVNSIVDAISSIFRSGILFNDFPAASPTFTSSFTPLP